MQPITQESVNKFLARLGLELVKSPELDPVRGDWVVLDADGEMWSGPFWSVCVFVAWLFEHSAYVLNEAEKFKRFQAAYAASDDAGREQLKKDLVNYHLGRTPASLLQIWDGEFLTPDSLPPDWQQRLVEVDNAAPGRTEFSKRAYDYMREFSQE